MGDLFDPAAMYDEDYLHFFAAPDDGSELASHGPVVPGADLPGEAAAEMAWRLAELRPGMNGDQPDSLRAIRSPGRSSRDLSGPRRPPAPFRFSDGASTIGLAAGEGGPGAGSAESSTGIGRAGWRAG
jgi:hypothetical protein